MTNNWVKIFSDVYLYKIQIVQSILAEHGIESVYINKQDSAYVVMMAEIELYSLKREALKAVNLIKEIDFEENQGTDED